MHKPCFRPLPPSTTLMPAPARHHALGLEHGETERDESEDDESPIIRYGTLSPAAQRRHGCRSFDPNDTRPIEGTARNGGDNVAEDSQVLESFPCQNYSPVNVAVHMRPYTPTQRRQPALRIPSPREPTQLVLTLAPLPDPFVVQPEPCLAAEQLVATQLKLVDVDIQLLEANLNALKRKHESDIIALEDNIRALKKKRDALSNIK